MEVCVVTGREELGKEHYYGEGGVALLSFHIQMMVMVVMRRMMVMVMVRRRRSIILPATVHLMASSNDLTRTLAANILPLTNHPFRGGYKLGAIFFSSCKLN